MWTYVQSSGEMVDAAGEAIAVGYSGHGAGRNCPEMEARREVGPLPAGMYRIGEMIPHTDRHGPCVLPLTQVEGETHGRSGFLIHGDNAAGDASLGCIILPRPARLAIAASGDRMLKVVAHG